MEVCLRFKNFNQIVVCILIFTEPRPVQTFSDWSSEMKSYTASSLKRLKINLASTTSPFSINYKIRQFRNLSRDLINNINELQSLSPTKLKLSWCFASLYVKLFLRENLFYDFNCTKQFFGSKTTGILPILNKSGILLPKCISWVIIGNKSYY